MNHNIILDFSGDAAGKRLNVYPLSSVSECDYPLFGSIGRYVNSCNGLLFFSGHRDGRFYIFNPATKESKVIPRPPSLDSPPPGFTSGWSCSGFGFDSRSNDYKIIMYVDHLFVDEDHDAGACGDDPDPPRDTTYAELYSLKTDSWKTLTDFPQVFFTDHPCVYADGSVHWLSPGTPYYVDSFDFADETFSSFFLEDIINNNADSNYDVSVVDCGGSLGVLAYQINSPCFELWVRQPAGWHKRWDFSLPQLDHRYYSAHDITILGVSREQVLYLAADARVFSYDCAANHLNNLRIRLHNYRAPVFISYVDSN